MYQLSRTNLCCQCDNVFILTLCLSPLLTTPFIPMAFLLVKVCALMACHLHPILCTWDACAVTTYTPVTVFFPLGVWLCLKNELNGLSRDRSVCPWLFSPRHYCYITEAWNYYAKESWAIKIYQNLYFFLWCEYTGTLLAQYCCHFNIPLQSPLISRSFLSLYHQQSVKHTLT